MARPIKDSLSYFPLDTDFFSDRKIKRLLKTFGGKGTTIFIFLLCEAYRNNGYFVQYDDDYPEDISSALGEGFNSNLVSDVTEFCLDCGLFDRHLFSTFGILTSGAIQRRYIAAKETTGKKTYAPESLLKPEFISRGFTGYNGEERVITTNNGEERGYSTKSKVKERKVKKRKGKESKKEHGVFNASDFFQPGADTSSQSKPPNQPPEVAIPENLQTDAFKSAWSEWQQHRKEIRKPLTFTSAKQQIQKLAQMGVNRAIEAIKHSITNGWQGIFEPKPQNNHQQPRSFMDTLNEVFPDEEQPQ